MCLVPSYILRYNYKFKKCCNLPTNIGLFLLMSLDDSLIRFSNRKFSNFPGIQLYFWTDKIILKFHLK